MIYDLYLKKIVLLTKPIKINKPTNTKSVLLLKPIV